MSNPNHLGIGLVPDLIPALELCDTTCQMLGSFAVRLTAFKTLNLLTGDVHPGTVTHKWCISGPGVKDLMCLEVKTLSKSHCPDLSGTNYEKLTYIYCGGGVGGAEIKACQVRTFVLIVLAG